MATETNSNPTEGLSVVFQTANYDVVLGVEETKGRHDTRQYWVVNVVTGIVEAKGDVLPVAIATCINFDTSLRKLNDIIETEGAEEIDTRLLGLGTKGKLDS